MTVDKRIIKVAMSGAQSTGKTTAAKALRGWAAGEYPGLRVALAPEVARSCLWSINEAASPEAQRWIFHRQICAELEAGREADVLICDRSALDNLVYSMWLQRHAWTGKNWGWIYGYMELLEIDWLATYALIWRFRVDGNLAIESDGVRSVNRDFQIDIDRLMEEVCGNLPEDHGLIFDWLGLEVAQMELRRLIGTLDKDAA